MLRLFRIFVLLFVCHRLCFGGTTDLLLPNKDIGISNRLAISSSTPQYSAPYQTGGLQSYPRPGGYLPTASTYPNQIPQPPSARTVCPDVCPLIFEPVCAASVSHPAQTFTNRCFLQMYNCKNSQSLRIISLGPCRCSMH